MDGYVTSLCLHIVFTLLMSFESGGHLDRYTFFEGILFNTIVYENFSRENISTSFQNSHSDLFLNTQQEIIDISERVQWNENIRS